MQAWPLDHPIWHTIRLAVVFLGLALILYINATKFDATELRALLFFLIVQAGAEGMSGYLGRRAPCAEPEKDPVP